MTTPPQQPVRSGNWNLPNAITIVRIVLAPVFLLLLLLDAGQDGVLRWVAAALFVLAIATDGIDGYLARKNNQITDLGKLLDPIADKALTGAALVGLSVLGELPWWVTGFMLLREVGITVYRMIVASKRVIPANLGGKIKTVVQAVAISFALAPLSNVVGSWIDYVNIALMSAAFLLTVLTGVIYLDQDWRLNQDPRRKRDGQGKAAG